VSAKHGRCLCGAVEYRVEGALRDVVYCHCKMCRRSSGHFFAATACAKPNLKIVRSEALRWYRSSPEAERGFCSLCGSNLFWRSDAMSHVAITPGTLDDPTGVKGAAHIFVADKGDYYTLNDRLPQHADGEHGVRVP